MINNKQNELQELEAQKCWEYLLKHKQGIAHFSQRFGKIKFTIELIRKLKLDNPNILICYPDNKIKGSFLDDFEKWNFKENVTFVNFSSLRKFDKTYYEIVICDEPQNLSIGEIESLSKIKYDYRILLSGTLNKETQSRLKQSLDIDIMSEYLIENAIKDNIVADYNITVHKVELNNTIKDRESKGKKITEKQLYDNYTFVIEKLKRESKDFMFLALHRNRISQSSLAKKNKTLQLLKQLEDKRCLVFTGLAKMAESLSIPYYHTKCKNTSDFDAFKEGNISKLALVGVGKVGVSYFGLDSIIINNFVGNSEELAQVISRSLLLDFKEKVGDIHILVLNEKAELTKLDKALGLLDKTKIRYA